MSTERADSSDATSDVPDLCIPATISGGRPLSGMSKQEVTSGSTPACLPTKRALDRRRLTSR